MNIYINYTEKLQDDAIYFAGISMYRILTDAQNFIYNNGISQFLKCFVCAVMDSVKSKKSKKV